jgi:hypothetical protein
MLTNSIRSVCEVSAAAESRESITVCSSKGQALQLTSGLDFLSIQAFGCGAVYLILGDVQEALMLLAFVFIIIGITFYQEHKTEHFACETTACDIEPNHSRLSPCAHANRQR